MAFTLPDLGFAYDALEPHIDAKTMEIHHTKHHAAYIAKANAALAGTEWEGKCAGEILSRIKELPDNIRTAVQNNLGGHANHKMFWSILAPAGNGSGGGGGTPEGELADAINNSFGSFEGFKEKFAEQAATRFGSGWALFFGRTRQTPCRLHRKPRLPNHDRPPPNPGPRCLGTRLLPQLPKPTPRLHQRLLECRQLDESRRQLRQVEISQH